MTLWQIALRNIRQNQRRYLAYLVSATFAVMIYFLYTTLILHPDLQGGYRFAENAVRGMKAAAIVIVIFTFLFLLYSNSAFIHQRMKEFGLLSLLGVSKGQLTIIILVESLAIGAMALGLGMAGGLLFLHLFLLSISAVLQLSTPLRFYAGWPVWLRTIEVFGGLFVLVSLASLREIVGHSVIDMLRAKRRPKARPTFSWLRALLGLALLLAGYIWACSPEPLAVVLGVGPVTLLVSLGTVFLMREGNIAILSWLHRRRRFFYQPKPFVTVNRLIYKMQENYQVLAAVSILMAVILTAIGTVFSLYMVVGGDTGIYHPHALQLIQRGEKEPEAAIREVEEVMAQHQLTDYAMTEVSVFQAQLKEKQDWVYVIPYSFYASQRRSAALPPPDPDEAILITPPAYLQMQNRQVADQPEPDRFADQLLLAGETLDLTIHYDRRGRLLNTSQLLAPAIYGLALADSVYARQLARQESQDVLHITFWDGEWINRRLYQAVTALRQQNAAEPSRQQHITSAAVYYYESIGSMGIALFIAFFVSLVFFAACFSILYSRLFTELEEERRYASRLEQLGAGHEVLRAQALSQAAVLFFLPFLVGMMHATFAMQALGTLVRHTVLHYGWLVALVYLLLYAVCFAGTFSAFWRTLRSGLQGQSI